MNRKEINIELVIVVINRINLLRLQKALISILRFTRRKQESGCMIPFRLILLLNDLSKVKILYLK